MADDERDAEQGDRDGHDGREEREVESADSEEEPGDPGGSGDSGDSGDPGDPGDSGASAVESFTFEDDSTIEILRHPSAEAVAHAVAGRLIARIGAVQAKRRRPHVVLTGGSIAGLVAEAVGAAAAEGRAEGIEWDEVEVWFGDDRFVEAADDERNVRLSAAMLDKLPFGERRVHVMAASDGDLDVDSAAEDYAAQLRRAADDDEPTPRFDVLMLGIGADAHCASLFPGRDEAADERSVVAVRNSPKPPATRITLTRVALQNASEVWWVAAGAGKAEAVHRALSPASEPKDVPAAGITGHDATLWFLDEEAAGLLPAPPEPER